MAPDPSRFRLRRYPNGRWRIVWTERRVTRSHSTGETTQAAAALYFARWLAEQARDDAPADPTVAAVLAYQLDEAAGRVADPARLRHGAKALRRHLGARIAAELRPVDSRAYTQARGAEGAGPGTIGYELRQLRAALRLAHAEGLIATFPAVKPPPRPQPRQRWITREEAARLVAACDAPHVRLFVQLAIHTGARSGAIRGLTWDRVDLEARVVDFADPEQAETRKGRAAVPLNDALHAALFEARREADGCRFVVSFRGRPIGDPRRAFQAAAARAGLDQLTPHALRHSVATWLADGGVDVQQIAAVLGHRDSRTTERVYIKRRAESLRGTLDRLG
jgi:integrase